MSVKMLKVIGLFTTLCLFAVAHIIICYFSFCSAGDVHTAAAAPNIPEIAKYFGTKGRYEEVNPYLLDDITAVNESLLKPPAAECRAIHLTAIIRHGTRYPTTKNIRKMQDLYKLVLANASGDASWLREIKTHWEMWYREDMDGRLVEKGREDHRNLAVRLARSFPLLFTEKHLRDGRVKFITSSKHRCVNSTIAFKQGLARMWEMEGEEIDHAVNDALMRFFDQCERFVQEVEKSKAALAEVELFKRRAEMRRTQEKLADRLQLPYSHITTDMVEAAFYLCSYEFTILNVDTPWCQLFDTVDAQVMEYANDLKQYWKRGYGHDINSRSSCILFHDLFSRLDRAAHESTSGVIVSELVTVQVGHAETLLPLLTLLGLFRDDDPLTSTNFAAQAGRVFRSGHMVPYAANLLVALYTCPDGLRLQARLNERPLPLPDLAETTPTYQAVRQRYVSLLQGCNQDEECQLTTHN